MPDSIQDFNYLKEHWPFLGVLSNKNVTVYEENGKWYLDVSYRCDYPNDPNSYVNVSISKIELPFLEKIHYPFPYDVFSAVNKENMYIIIPSAVIDCGRTIISKEQYGETREMTLSEIEKALGHGVILKEEE